MSNETIVIYRAWCRHWITGAIIRPKNGKVLRIELTPEEYEQFLERNGKKPSGN